MHFRALGKVLAVVSALALGGTYVACRQYQSRVPEPDAGKAPALPSSKNPNRVIVLPSSKKLDSVIPPGSSASPRTNSDFIQPPEFSGGETEEGKRRRDILLQSSKGGVIFPPGSPSGDAKAEETKRPLLPSSKLGPILSPDDVPIDKKEESKNGEKK